MVKLHVKRRDESQFQYETTTETKISDIVTDVTAIYNGRLKVYRISNEIEQLSKYGPSFPPEKKGLTNVQIKKQNLVDHRSSDDDYIENKDPNGIRNGKAPNKKMSELLISVVKEARSTVSNKSVEADTCLTLATIQDVLDALKGTVHIAYPKGLPHYDPIQSELENDEKLQATEIEPEVIQTEIAKLWWAGKELKLNKTLKDYVGDNEKTKIIVVLQKAEEGPPRREPALTEEQRKQLMLQAYQRQEELKRLEVDEDDSYLDSKWADQQSLKRAFHGVQDIGWKPT